MLILCAVIWGAAFVAQSVGMEYIGPYTFQAVRCFMALAELLPIIALVDLICKKNFLIGWKSTKLWKAGILCGIPLFLATILQQYALVETDAGKSAFLTAMYIIFVPIINIFRKKKPSVFNLIGSLLACVGLYFLCCFGVSQINSNDLLLLGCALMFALQILFIDLYAQEVDVIRLHFIQILVCFILSAVLMFLTEKPTWANIWDCKIPLAYAGMLSMGIAYLFQIIGQKGLDPTPSSIIMSMESVFAVLFGALLLHERLSQWEIIGCTLLLSAVILSQIPGRKNCAA